MSETKQPDQILAELSLVSLKREPACVAFLPSDAVSPPKVIDYLRLDLSSADYVKSAQLWITLEAKSVDYPEEWAPLLGFKLEFWKIFLHQFALARSSQKAFDILPGANGFIPAVEHITERYNPTKISLVPCEARIMVDATWENVEQQTLFHLPRTDSFAKAFLAMGYRSWDFLSWRLNRMERIQRLKKMPERTKLPMPFKQRSVR